MIIIKSLFLTDNMSMIAKYSKKPTSSKVSHINYVFSFKSHKVGGCRRRHLKTMNNLIYNQLFWGLKTFKTIHKKRVNLQASPNKWISLSAQRYSKTTVIPQSTLVRKKITYPNIRNLLKVSHQMEHLM